jgi:hypothetical protein
MAKHARHRAPRPTARKQPAWLVTLTALTALAQTNRLMFTQQTRHSLAQHRHQCPICGPGKPVDDQLQCGHCLLPIPEGPSQ